MTTRAGARLLSVALLFFAGGCRKPDQRSAPPHEAASAPSLAALVEPPPKAQGAPTPLISLQTFDAELDEMTEPHWIEERLATFPPMRLHPELGKAPIPEADALGKLLRDGLAAPVEAAAEVARDGAPGARDNAWAVLRELEELAIPALAGVHYTDPQSRLRAATVSLEAELALQARIAERLEPMLAERASLAYHWHQPKQGRFCDLAFVLLRMLRRAADDAEAYLRDEWSVDDRLPEAERDRRILEARSRAFRTDPKDYKPSADPAIVRWRDPKQIAAGRARRATMEQRLLGLDEGEARAFGRGLRERLRRPVRELARLRADGGAPLAWAATLTLMQLETASLSPLVELPLPLDPIARGTFLRNVIRGDLKLRKKVFEQIDGLLSETAPRTTPGDGRVCDAGYALMRRAVDFGDDLPEVYPGEGAFYALAEATRDRAISLARATRLWGQLR